MVGFRTGVPDRITLEKLGPYHNKNRKTLELNTWKDTKGTNQSDGIET